MRRLENGTIVKVFNISLNYSSFQLHKHRLTHLKQNKPIDRIRRLSEMASSMMQTSDDERALILRYTNMMIELVIRPNTDIIMVRTKWNSLISANGSSFKKLKIKAQYSI